MWRCLLVTNCMFIFYLQPQLMWRRLREGNHIWSAPCLKQLESLIITVVIVSSINERWGACDCLGIVCSEIPLSAHEPATYIIFVWFLVQLSDREHALSGICCQMRWTLRRQRPHYELSLCRDLASSQKRGRQCYNYRRDEWIQRRPERGLAVRSG